MTKFIRIFFICSLLLSFSHGAYATNKNDLVTELKNVVINDIIETFYEDFDSDGDYELLAFTGNLNDDGILDKSKVWYVDKNGVKLLSNRGGLGIVYHSEYAPAMITQKDNILIQYQYKWGNGNVKTTIFTLKNGSPYVYDYDGYLDNTSNGYILEHEAYDGVITKEKFEKSLFSGTVRTTKKYWYYWDTDENCLKEYGAIPISQEQFLEFNGAENILNSITTGDIYNILYRDNGIINVNIIEEFDGWQKNDSYHISHLVVQYNENSVWIANNIRTQIGEGLYLEALVPDNAVYPEFKSPQIKVVLNGEKINFDQPPIMTDDRILVPIRKIAEAMGDTVMWNEEYQTAFIKHEDRGLIIKLLEDHIKIVRNEYWTQWEEKELDVVAFSLNGRTLVPVRAFCESLGADVKWDGESYTAHITYDFNKKYNKMTSSTFANINTVYYALNNDDVSFDAYSDDLNYFYNDRNHQKDAVKMGVSDIWAGVNDLLSGLTNSENIMKNSFEQMLSAIPNNDVISIDKELYDDIKDFVDSGKDIFDEVSGIDDEFLKLHPSLKVLDTSIEAVGTAYDIMSFSSEQLAVFLSNYEMNIAYIEGLRSILEENNLVDDELNTSLVVLQQEYSDKFFNVMLNTRDELEKFTITEGTNLATGGFFSVGLFTWEQLFKLSGITDDGQALKTFYGLYCINGILDTVYNQINNKILSGNYTSSEVADLKILDDLQKALKIKSYQCIKIISQDSDTHIMCDDYVKQLSKSCILWKK